MRVADPFAIEARVTEARTMTPPCGCGCARFGYVQDVAIKIVTDAKIGSGNVLQPRTSLYVCLDCGTLRWQLLEHVEFLRSVRHEVMRADPVAPGTPYR
jgi:hypothetical protein